MYSNNLLNFQESTIILNGCTKKSGNLLKAPRNSTTHIIEKNRNDLGIQTVINSSKTIWKIINYNNNLLAWLIVFYGLSTIVGSVMPNPILSE